MNRIEELFQKLKTHVPEVEADLDPPDNPSAPWFLDARLGENALVMEWRPGLGFGLTSISDDRAESYGESSPDEFFLDGEDAFKRTVALLTTGGRTAPPRSVDLRRLRERKLITQEELAALVGVRQATISKLERRGSEMSIEALQSIIRALGGQLELCIRFSQQREPIRLDTDAADSDREYGHTR